MKTSSTFFSVAALAAILFIFGGVVESVNAQGAPANDNCANASVISGSSITVSGDNTNATVETFESNRDGYFTVWYAWTAQADGDVTINVTNANGSYKFQHVVTIYLGSGIQSINLINYAVGGNALNPTSALATVTFPAKSGLTYRICFGSYANGSGNNYRGPFSFTLDQAAQATPWSYGPAMPSTNAPSNDDCANAVAMTGASLNVVGYNASATVETGEDQILPNQTYPNRYNTVWYAWTAQQDGDVTLTMTNANYSNTFQHQITVYLGGGIQSLNLINSALGGTGLQFNNALATVAFPAKSGLTYRICIGSYANGVGNGYSGPFSFTLAQANQTAPWSYGPAMPTSNVPSNDNCANAVAMTGASLNVVGYNASATVETGEAQILPNQTYPNGYYTVWYAWTAQQDGDVTLTMTNANYSNTFQHQITVYLGGGIQSLNLLNSALGGTGLQFNNALATVTFPAKSGLTYRICVGSYANGVGNAYSGPFSFTLAQANQTVPWSYGPAMPTSNVPSNDNCANAVAMTGTLLNVVGYNPSATVETPEVNYPNGYKTIWYSWAAPQDGDVIIEVTNANYGYAFQHKITVYLGNGYQTLNLVNSAIGGNGINFNNAPAALTFPAKSGLTYSIALGSYANGVGNQYSGPISFTLTQASQLQPWDFGPSAPTSTVPNNDAFANATPISGLPVQIVGYNASATTEIGEPTQDGYKSLWYEWTAPSTGAVIIAVTDANGAADFQHEIVAYTGNSLAALHLVAGAAGGTGIGDHGAPAAIKIDVTAGTIYHLCFASYTNGSGNSYSGPFSFVIAPPSGVKPFATEAGVYEGILGNGAGLLSVTVASNGAFTGKLSLNGKTYALRGAFDSTGNYHGTVGRPPLQISFAIGRKGNTYAIVGTAGGETVDIFKGAYSKSATLAESPAYTILLAPTQSGASVPQGFGYATLTVSRTGNARMAGRLADGTSFSLSGPILSDSGSADQFVIYDSALYRSKGMLSGVVTFDVGANSDCDASVEWIKPGSSSHYYGQGIDTTLNLTGSVYQAARGTMALGLASTANNAVVEISGGDLGATVLQESVTYTAANTVLTASTNIPKLKMKVTLSTGVFSGAFLDPQSSRTAAFGGVLYQKKPQAAGFFLGAAVTDIGLSGPVTLEP